MAGRWIDEGLVWVGPRPPDGVGRPADWVELPHESYIPIPKSRLEEVLRAHPRARAAGPAFDHLLRLVQGLLHFQHHETLNLLKEDYLLFSPDERELVREHLSATELARRERRFLGNFMRAAVLGNFTPMSDADYRRGIEQTYLLDVPVEIDWRRHDPGMLADFLRWADGDEGGPLRAALRLEGSVRDFLSLPAEFGTRALVLWRGVERDQASGRFVAQRLDLIANRVIGVLTYPVVRPVQRFVEWRRRRGAAEVDPPARREAASTTIFERRWLARRNLRNLGLFHRLFRVVRLQEPVLRQVIILFRLGGDATIHLKMFRNIPMADSELVFPEKKIRMGSFDVALLIISAAAAIPALALRGAAGTALLLGLGMMLFKIVGHYLNVRGKYMARMTRNLYEKNLDNSIGVLQYLVDSLEEQEYKEAVLVYFVLWSADRPMREAEIDAAVEALLAEGFAGVEVAFEVDDALRKVVDRGPATPLPLVDPEGDDRYRAKPLAEALRVLDERWDGLFDYASRDARG